MEDNEKYATLSLIDASQLDNLAADTKKALVDSKITMMILWMLLSTNAIIQKTP